MSRFEEKSQIRSFIELLGILENQPAQAPVVPVPQKRLQEMKIREVRGGLVISVNNEENELIEKIEKEGSIRKSNLSEREREVAFRLTSRGVLLRLREEDEIAYRFNGLDDVWRD
jgi:hypothetical protein